MKQLPQDLRSLLDRFGHEHFPNIFNQLNPNHRIGRVVIPFLGSEDSNYALALKMTALCGLKKKSTIDELVKKFYRMGQRKQLWIAYNLSHEMKVASLAAAIAMSNQDSNVYEIGPCFGFSSLHFSHLLKEKKVHAKPINKLIAIESNKEWLEQAQEIKKMTGDYAEEIEYVHGNGISYIMDSAGKGDVIFSSLAEPSVLNGILALSDLKQINLIVSYSEKTNEKLEEMTGKQFEDLMDSNSYDIFPFEDKEYNAHITWETEKIGVLALPLST